MEPRKRNSDIKKQPEVQGEREMREQAEINLNERIKEVEDGEANSPIQYPSNPGYHGTDDEKDLSPEE